MILYSIGKLLVPKGSIKWVLCSFCDNHIYTFDDLLYSFVQHKNVRFLFYFWVVGKYNCREMGFLRSILFSSVSICRSVYNESTDHIEDLSIFATLSTSHNAQDSKWCSKGERTNSYAKMMLKILPIVLLGTGKEGRTFNFVCWLVFNRATRP